MKSSSISILHTGKKESKKKLIRPLAAAWDACSGCSAH